jgi:hypothetical protein
VDFFQDFVAPFGIERAEIIVVVRMSERDSKEGMVSW